MMINANVILSNPIVFIPGLYQYQTLINSLSISKDNETGEIEIKFKPMRKIN